MCSQHIAILYLEHLTNWLEWQVRCDVAPSYVLTRAAVPWDYPHLSDKSITTSPFTLVFQRAGSRGAASTMNAVILSSVLSAGNHALFAGTRVLYSLSIARQAPAIFHKTTSRGVPLAALLATSSISVLCLGTSYVGAGEIWGWLQNIVGVSNQIAWLSIGLASWRFRAAWIVQGRSLDELKFQGARWTWSWGPPFVVCSVTALIISASTSFALLFVARNVEFVFLQFRVGRLSSRFSRPCRS
jgi:amino acid transporter, AAT family